MNEKESARECVRERETERETERQRDGDRESIDVRLPWLRVVLRW